MIASLSDTNMFEFLLVFIVRWTELVQKSTISKRYYLKVRLGGFES